MPFHRAMIQDLRDTILALHPEGERFLTWTEETLTIHGIDPATFCQFRRNHVQGGWKNHILCVVVHGGRTYDQGVYTTWEAIHAALDVMGHGPDDALAWLVRRRAAAAGQPMA